LYLNVKEQLMPTALVTGASRGLGLAFARALSSKGWSLVLTARHDLPALDGAVLIPGDVSEADHSERLAEAGPVDLLVNNASDLGPSPMPALRDYRLDDLRRVYEVNVFAPLALVQLLQPQHVINISSDAGLEAYVGWGGYGSSKAALDHLAAVLALEEPARTVQAFDPGDMRTQMHQEAFPGEDISDRPLPESVVPAMLRLLDLPSGRYLVADLQPAVAR
jgi:NAD(P)-dependent dehydrogenase (short-subunit alcohol dehydrogenase family)